MLGSNQHMNPCDLQLLDQKNPMHILQGSWQDLRNKPRNPLDIVEAVERGEFHIWAINHVTQAMTLLLGKAAAIVQTDESKHTEHYASDCVFGIAQHKLNALRALSKTNS